MINPEKCEWDSKQNPSDGRKFFHIIRN